MFHRHFSVIFLFHCKTTRNKNEQRQMIFEHLNLDSVVCFEVFCGLFVFPLRCIFFTLRFYVGFALCVLRHELYNVTFATFCKQGTSVKLYT